MYMGKVQIREGKEAAIHGRDGDGARGYESISAVR